MVGVPSLPVWLSGSSARMCLPNPSQCSSWM